MVYPRYSQLFPALKEVRDSLENSYIAAQKGVEEKALSLYNSDKAAAVKYLNDYSVEKSDEMIARWRQLATYLIVKFNDMTIKPEKDGQFLRTKTGLGERVKRPGYSNYFKQQIVKQTGDRFLMPTK